MKITKKLFKETEIRNLEVARDFYNDEDYRKLSDKEYTFFLLPGDLRVSLSRVKSLEVTLEKDFLVNVAIMENGDKIFINI